MCYFLSFCLELYHISNATRKTIDTNTCELLVGEDIKSHVSASMLTRN